MSNIFMGIGAVIVCVFIRSILYKSSLEYGAILRLASTFILPIILLGYFPLWFVLILFAQMLHEDLGIDITKSPCQRSFLQMKYGDIVDVICLIITIIAIGMAIFRYVF